jgi:7-cyano-7-deazaguanine synthase
MRFATILLSGGLDSTTLLFHAWKNLGYDRIYALSVHYGQRHNREIACATYQAQCVPIVAEHHTIDISFMGELLQSGTTLVTGGNEVPDLEELSDTQRSQPPTYVPNRNMMLLSMAAAYAESQDCRTLLYGAQAQDQYGYWDCTQTFVDRLNHVLSLNRATPIHVDAPFVNLSKGDCLRIGIELGIDYAQTWSCYRGKDKPCQTCPTCVERARAFEQIGQTDPLLHY